MLYSYGDEAAWSDAYDIKKIQAALAWVSFYHSSPSSSFLWLLDQELSTKTSDFTLPQMVLWEQSESLTRMVSRCPQLFSQTDWLGIPLFYARAKTDCLLVELAQRNPRALLWTLRKKYDLTEVPTRALEMVSFLFDEKDPASTASLLILSSYPGFCFTWNMSPRLLFLKAPKLLKARASKEKVDEVTLMTLAKNWSDSMESLIKASRILGPA